MSMSQPVTPENRRPKVSWRKKLMKSGGSRESGLAEVEAAMGWISPSTSGSSANEAGSPRAKGWKPGGHLGGYSSYSGDTSQVSSRQGTPRKTGITFLGLLHKTRTPGESPKMSHESRWNEMSHEPDMVFNGSVNPFLSPPLALQEFTIPKPKPRGPQVRPFIYTEAHQSTSTRPNLSTRCVICDESLKTKLQEEKIIDLKCGDFVHNECFQITINYEIERLAKTSSLDSASDQPTLIRQIFPRCTGSECVNNGSDKPMVPADDAYVDKIIVNALIAQQDLASKHKNSNLVALSSTLESNRVYDDLNTPRNSKTSIISPLKTPAFTANPGLDFISPGEPVIPSRHLRARSIATLIRESSIATRSPSPNSSISTINTGTIKISNYKGVSIETLKDNFIQYLIDSCSHFSLSSLLKLGPLRLVDQLLVSTSNTNSFNERICYLFTNFLVIWSLDTLFPVLFPLDPKELSVNIQGASILRMKTKNPKSFLKEILLKSEIDSIIEKWVVAVSDFNFNFPSDVLTSTIILPEYNTKSDLICEFGLPDPQAKRNSSQTVTSSKKSSSTIDVVEINNSKLIEPSISYPGVSDQGISLHSNNIYYSDSDSKSLPEEDKTNPLTLEKARRSEFSIEQETCDNNDDDDDDDDDDSDQELIDNILKDTDAYSSNDGCEKRWTALFADITLALNQNYQESS